MEFSFQFKEASRRIVFFKLTSATPLASRALFRRLELGLFPHCKVCYFPAFSKQTPVGASGNRPADDGPRTKAARRAGTMR
jgi:hypothetical protein